MVAVVVPETGSNADMEALMAATGAKLAKFKQPKEVIVVDELPRNTMGKVQKNVLRSMYGDLFMQKAANAG